MVSSAPASKTRSFRSATVGGIVVSTIGGAPYGAETVDATTVTDEDGTGCIDSGRHDEHYSGGAAAAASHLWRGLRMTTSLQTFLVISVKGSSSFWLTKSNSVMK